MFVSLLDCLLQTFIFLLKPMFDGLMLNFVQACSSAVGVTLNSVIGGMVGYICAAICRGIFARDIDAVFTLVCVLFYF